jgi:glycosyltransferase involved in cell wall biosynthesis
VIEMPSRRIPLSVIVPTGNRIDVVEDCLQSVRWVDELIVVDSFSTDGTLDVAKKYADRVLQHEYVNSALQKNWAIPQATHAWVMIVDTDERVSPQLRNEIKEKLRDPLPYVGYRIPRVNLVFGKPIRGARYYPDYQIRLFLRDAGRYELRRVHAHVLLDGPCGTLKSPLIHYTHRFLNQTICDLLVLMTTWEAEQREHNALSAGRQPTKNLFLNLLFRPVGAFGLRYFREGGWRDGYRGLIVSLVWAVYIAITYMKIWERSLNLPEQWWVDDWENRQGKEANS